MAKKTLLIYRSMTFHAKLINYLHRYKIKLNPHRDFNVLSAIETAYQRDGRSRLTLSFVYRALNAVKKTPQVLKRLELGVVESAIEALEKAQRKRSPAHRFRHWFTRKGEASFKILHADKTPLTPQKVAKMTQCDSEVVLSFSPPQSTSVQSSYAARERLMGSSGTFEHEATIGSLAFWRKLTPQKESQLFSPHRQRFNRALSPTANDSSTVSVDRPVRVERFSFTVTAETLQERKGQPRPVSQQQVMGASALSLFAQGGAILGASVNGRHFHLAHRQGFAFGGAQSRNNLDPMTAASNYETLFKVENIISDLITKQGQEKVDVEGEVHFDRQSPVVPYKIVYRIEEADKLKREVIIDPRSHRLPRDSETRLMSDASSIVRELFK